MDRSEAGATCLSPCWMLPVFSNGRLIWVASVTNAQPPWLPMPAHVLVGHGPSYIRVRSPVVTDAVPVAEDSGESGLQQILGGVAVSRDRTRRSEQGRAPLSYVRREVQPRLGISYQLRDSVGDKAYANWGRYFNMDQKSSGRSLAPNRIFQTQTIFDLTGAVISTAPLASTTGKLIAAGRAEPQHGSQTQERHNGWNQSC